MTADRAAEVLARHGHRFERVQLCASGRLWYAIALRPDGEASTGRGLTAEDACANLVVAALAPTVRGAA